MVSQVPDNEYSITRRRMLAGIDVCMGGKAAEELIFGEPRRQAEMQRLWVAVAGLV